MSKKRRINKCKAMQSLALQFLSFLTPIILLVVIAIVVKLFQNGTISFTKIAQRIILNDSTYACLSLSIIATIQFIVKTIRREESSPFLSISIIYAVACVIAIILLTIILTMAESLCNEYNVTSVSEIREFETFNYFIALAVNIFALVSSIALQTSMGLDNYIVED